MQLRAAVGLFVYPRRSPRGRLPYELRALGDDKSDRAKAKVSARWRKDGGGRTEVVGAEGAECPFLDEGDSRDLERWKAIRDQPRYR